MTKKACLLAALLLSVALLGGCVIVQSPATSQKSGTFGTYETTREQHKSKFVVPEGIDYTPPPIYEDVPTGFAFVRVDGMRVKAKCPIEGLKKGQKITVRLNDDGSWAVIGKAK